MQSMIAEYNLEIAFLDLIILNVNILWLSCNDYLIWMDSAEFNT